MNMCICGHEFDDHLFDGGECGLEYDDGRTYKYRVNYGAEGIKRAIVGAS